LALGDFDLALRGLLGDGAPLSAASIARLKAGWRLERSRRWRPADRSGRRARRVDPNNSGGLLPKNTPGGYMSPAPSLERDVGQLSLNDLVSAQQQ